MSDHRIHLTNIYFTPSTTIIGNYQPLVSESYLKIEIIPSYDGLNIKTINIIYFDPTDSSSCINEEISDASVFQAITFSLKGESSTLLHGVISYMKSLCRDDVNIIVKEYSKYIQDGVVLDGFMAGLCSYLTFLFLNENGTFVKTLPFQFSCPTSVMSGNIVNHNMFQYMSLPLISLTKTSTGIILQITTFVQSFINMWDPLFTTGPIIGTVNETKMCIEIVTALSSHVCSLMAETKSQQEIIINRLSDIELRLQHKVNTSLSTLTKNIDLLLSQQLNDTRINEIIQEAITKQ